MTVTASNGATGDTPDHGSEDQTSSQPAAASENEAAEAQEVSIAGSTMRKSAQAIADQQNQATEPGRAALTTASLASSAHSQSQAKASQAVENQVTDSNQQAGDQGAAQQIVVSPPAVTPEIFLVRSLQSEAASPAASAEPPAFPAARWSNANSTAQTESDGAGASQSASPSASPASTDPSLLASASAAELMARSAFAFASTFSPSMILSSGDSAAASTDKASSFKSSGATFTANSSDTNSSKTSSAQGSIAADHSAQNGNPLPQRVPGDSSAASPLAIKPLEASVTQTAPVSNHATLTSSSQPHAASSASDALMKAQDSADAAAEQLERASSASAAGISTARLMQSMSESEMRVGMHSAEFGDISIRTSVSQQQLTAQINVDHSELGTAIAAHLPSLASKLGGEFGLHASIEVNQLGGSVTGGNGQSSHQNHKMTSQTVLPDSSTLNAEGDPIMLPAESLVDSRLDIRA
jgi:hypothetical protein